MSFSKDDIKADNLVYGSLKESEADEVVEFMAQHFYPREPLVREYLGFPSEKYTKMRGNECMYL